MKKLLLFSICCLLITGQIFAQTRIQVSSEKTQLKVTQNSREGFSVNNSIAYFDIQLEKLFTTGEYVQLALDGYGPSYNIGNPDLPVFNRLIEVPLGATVEVNIIGYEELVFNLSDYDINMQLFPSQESVSKSDDYSNIELKKNEDTYSTNKMFSNPIARFHDEGIMRGVRLGRLEISPFAYNPVTGELLVINDLNVQIKFVKGDYEKTDRAKRQHYSPAFNGIFSGLLNYAPPSREDLSLNSIPMRFVLISDPMFENTLVPFVEWKKKQGFIVDVFYTTQVGTTTTAIKNFLQGLYTDPAEITPAFIAFVGDVQQIPAYNGTTGSHPSDLYYVTYDGPTDILPDVFIGRMSAQNPSQLESIINKTLMYERFEMPDPTYLTKTITIAGYDSGYAPLYGNGALNYMAHYLNPAHGITPFEMFHPCNGQGSTVISKLNEGVSIGVYTAHCDVTLWGDPSVTVNNINNLTNNEKYGLLIGNCCLSNKFDASECFGEAVIRATNKGGVGYLGASNSTYWSEDYWWATGFGTVVVQPQIQNFGVGSFDALFNCREDHGGTPVPAESIAITASQMNMAGCLAVNASSSSMKKYYWEIYHLMGDPTLMPFAGPMPAMTPNYMNTVIIGTTSLAITDLAPGCYVALTDNGELIAAGFADNTGSIELEFAPLATPTLVDLVATTTFYQPYFGNVEIIPASGPYIVPGGYTVTGDEILTYISTNTEIEVTLKNVGIEATTALTVTIACDDPQLTITNNTATCAGVAPNGTATVKFNVTVANDIPDNKSFSLNVNATEGGKASWNNNMTIKAYAPVFSLETVKVNGVVDGNLPKGTVATITTVIKNKGGAEAFDVKGTLDIFSNYVTLACDDGKSRDEKNLPAGDEMELTFTVITDPEMPFGHTADIDLNLTAQYGRTAKKDFTVTCTGSNSYCSSGTQNASSNDIFTSVILYKTSDPSNLLINNTNPGTNGYQDYTSIVVPLEPGQQYTIKVKCGYNSNQVGGWFDLNGNNVFDNNEKLITLNCSSANTEYTQNFNIPADFVPGTHRFRLVTKWNAAPVACNNSSYGQTHDYSIMFPELYPRVQNVEASIAGSTITVIWEAPEDETPNGYNVYRNGNKLNTALITATTFAEENVTEGIYVYNVTAVYNGGESYSEMSNVICNFETCEIPLNLAGTAEEKTAILTWDPPVSVNGLGYNVYRDDIKINSEILTAREYHDEELENGTYIYKVSAVYDNLCTESELTEGVSVVIDFNSITDISTDLYKIYPNPTTGIVAIEGIGLNRVEIYNILGSKLAEYNNVADHLKINVNHLADGLYFVKLYSETNGVVTKRLVIVK